MKYNLSASPLQKKSIYSIKITLKSILFDDLYEIFYLNESKWKLKAQGGYENHFAINYKNKDRSTRYSIIVTPC